MFVIALSRLYNTLLATLNRLLDYVETALAEAQGWIKPDEIMSTYFKTAKQQMDETKVQLEQLFLRFLSNI